MLPIIYLSCVPSKKALGRKTDTNDSFYMTNGSVKIQSTLSI